MLDVLIGVRVTKEDYAGLLEIAEEEDRTVAAVARRLIRQGLSGGCRYEPTPV